MSYLAAWGSIYARIDGLRNAAELYARFQGVNSSDTFGMGKELAKSLGRCFEEIVKFETTYASRLPQTVGDLIRGFVNKRADEIRSNASRGNSREAQAHLVFVVSIAAEISHLLTDSQETIRATSERAFLHLQQLIAVDKTVRANWITAFQDGEVACERLGAVHLLWHGIYAFKAHGGRERTDLIFNDPLTDVDRSGVAGLVLTEWKVAKNGGIERVFSNARKQALLYAAGALSGLELAGYRYAVVVTDKPIAKAEMPSDFAESGVIWRHINIAVNPDTPSKASTRI